MYQATRGDVAGAGDWLCTHMAEEESRVKVEEQNLLTAKKSEATKETEVVVCVEVVVVVCVELVVVCV